jgi:hypothetical protein
VTARSEKKLYKGKLGDMERYMSVSILLLRDGGSYVI